MTEQTEEDLRIQAYNEGKEDWLHWGPYLSERQWGTVREDYSANGDAWGYFPHDHARSRTYRWGEDGMAGISDRYCNICFGIALWNGKDPILKERLFGLTGPQGNHGEDVKELYYYLENTPSHSYMKHLYKYPQAEFPYAALVAENSKRSREELEYELLDTGIFDKDAYFDVFTEYAKQGPEDILIRITVTNHAAKSAPIHLLPTLWIRNFWSFREMEVKPQIRLDKNSGEVVNISHEYVGDYQLYFEKADRLLFTENESNRERVYGDKNNHPFKKDLFHDAVTQGDYTLATRNKQGTKFAPQYVRELAPGESCTIRLRLSKESIDDPFGSGFEAVMEGRRSECDDFYRKIAVKCTDEEFRIQKQAFAGMLWTKQYYNYEVERWLEGDKKNSVPPPERWYGRNHSWKTLRSHDIMLMPDAWEYPWYAAWDSAFHCVTMAMIDAEFAKKQLLLFTKEWYMKPNGQIPAYEWSFSDVNPPVQAWAAIEIYQIDRRKTGKGDIKFLKRMFNKLALNFTWWVNRLDSSQKNVFEGGFLGLDNIGVFDRSKGIPGGGILEQVDGTSWMALYCLNMLEMSLEIAIEDDAYEDMATKYFGHFIFIAEALNTRSRENEGTWDEEEGFFYDKLILPDGRFVPIKVRSIAGMLSLAAVLCIKKQTLDKLPKFKASVGWFKRYRLETMKFPVIQEYVEGDDLLLSLVPKDRMPILVKVLLDESEFLSPYGIRSLSKKHEEPYSIDIEGTTYSINYEPAESSVPLFGGNSNWRGPVWFPMNYLFINALREYYSYCGEDMKFQYPTGAGEELDLHQIAHRISKRLVRIFKTDTQGSRAVNGLHQEQYQKEHFRDYILFYEYFHGDNGRGVGASHQTGWTALVANLIADIHKGS
ncbi:MGH1-like glycoside hydrolase domain-containing protein [Zeaxanthinibacter enoshimensis]|uniref:mannosyl-oligosaccharide glucosidase n=1 Tax=Zeaxanthinibacter enoshimensis TaxID=392009 RepID=A0A4V3D410_9FLAO|nr:glucosidase [Zeaxanthinibacter enoshimensis]TDQ32561.1 glycosyl hydrolase family 63 [Zeaxanthinibacter enoshimensis]